MVLKLRFIGEIGRGVDPGKRSKVMIEMCLVEISALKSDLRPIDRVPFCEVAGHMA